MMAFIIVGAIVFIFGAVFAWSCRRESDDDLKGWRQRRMMSHLSDKMTHGPNFPLGKETKISRYSLPRRADTAKK